MSIWPLLPWFGDEPVPLRVYASYQLPGVFDMFGLGKLASLLHVYRDRVPGWLIPRVNFSRLAILGGLLMVFAGVVSYSVYLWHVPVMDWITNARLIQIVGGYRFPALLLVAIPLIYLIATCSYLLVERPFIRMRRK